MWTNTGKSHYWVSNEFNLELINFLHFVNVYQIEIFYAKFIIISLIPNAHLTTLYIFVQQAYLYIWNTHIRLWKMQKVLILHHFISNWLLIRLQVYENLLKWEVKVEGSLNLWTREARRHCYALEASEIQNMPAALSVKFQAVRFTMDSNVCAVNKLRRQQVFCTVPAGRGEKTNRMLGSRAWWNIQGLASWLMTQTLLS